MDFVLHLAQAASNPTSYLAEQEIPLYDTAPGQNANPQQARVYVFKLAYLKPSAIVPN